MLILEVRRKILLAAEETFKPFQTSIYHRIETSRLICKANQQLGFYMMGGLVLVLLITSL